jgi:hypothetical protein
MSYRLFTYKFICPFCDKWTDGHIGGEHSGDYEIKCKKCQREIKYDFRIAPSIEQNFTLEDKIKKKLKYAP